MIDPQILPQILTPAEVADLFRVAPKTVTRWETEGRLASVRTLGGHRRYERAEVLRLIADTRAQRRSE